MSQLIINILPSVILQN